MKVAALIYGAVFGAVVMLTVKWIGDFKWSSKKEFGICLLIVFASFLFASFLSTLLFKD